MSTLPQKPESRSLTIKDFMQKPETLFRLEQSLGNAMQAQRLARLALDAVGKNAQLQECSQESMLLALLDCAQLKLEPVLGFCYLIPYGKDAKLILGYKGLCELVRRSGTVSVIEANTVYERDTFDIEYGTQPRITHKPCLKGEKGAIVGFYARGVYHNGHQQFVWMSKAEVDAIRERSRSRNSPAWENDYAEMGKKTAVRRLCKMLPLSVEDSETIERDDQADFGEFPKMREITPTPKQTSRDQAASMAEQMGATREEVQPESHPRPAAESSPPPAGEPPQKRRGRPPRTTEPPPATQSTSPPRAQPAEALGGPPKIRFQELQAPENFSGALDGDQTALFNRGMELGLTSWEIDAIIYDRSGMIGSELRRDECGDFKGILEEYAAKLKPGN